VKHVDHFEMSDTFVEISALEGCSGTAVGKLGNCDLVERARMAAT
jgi:hypothetical protein